MSWLRDQQGAMIELPERIVNVDSGSRDRDGVNQVADIVCEYMRAQGPQPQRVGQRAAGCSCIASATASNDHGPRRSILLLAHQDTVFPKGEAARRPFRIDGGKAFGPGVADMKAGVVINAFLACAFARFSPQSSLVALFTGDEELASPSSRGLIKAEGNRTIYALNTEPGPLDGSFVAGRKGGVFMKIDIAGKSAHAGANFHDGRSAIQELALKIQALHALTDTAKGLTVNVGLVGGGQSVNTVAPHARCEVDLRYVDPADREGAIAGIRNIATASFTPDVTAEFRVEGEFLPLPETDANRELAQVYVANASAIGHSVRGIHSGGCSDSGFAAAMGAICLCGLGALGAHPHSADEYILIDSLVPRTLALARTILHLSHAN